jgi:hypothetical protein
MSDRSRLNGRASVVAALTASRASSVVQAKVTNAPKLRSMRDSLRLFDGRSSTHKISCWSFNGTIQKLE